MSGEQLRVGHLSAQTASVCEHRLLGQLDGETSIGVENHRLTLRQSKRVRISTKPSQSISL